MMDIPNMPARAVQISLDSSLLKEVDRTPEARKQGRSQVIATALRLYLRARKRKDTDAAITRAFSGKADELLREIEPMMESQAWPEE